MRIFQGVLLAGSWAYSIFNFFRRLGPLGLFLLSALDSSFLFLPFGNDLLLIALVSSDRRGSLWILYVAMSAAGSMLGGLVIDLLMRKAGEEGLERFVKPKRIENLKVKIEKKAGWAVFFSTLIPPPFPFTPVVMTASALQMPRKKLLGAVFSGRIIRFGVEALLAIYFGKRLMSYMNSDVLEYFVYGLIAIAVTGSIFSIMHEVVAQARQDYFQKE